MPGPPPKPTAIKIATGNPGKRPLNRHEPKPGGIAVCPRHLPKIAKREFRRVNRELKVLGLSTALDNVPLAIYAEAYARWVEAKANVAKYGMVIKTSNGNPIINPYQSVVTRAEETIYRFAIQFGFTPAARTSLTVEPPSTTANPWADFEVKEDTTTEPRRPS